MVVSTCTHTQTKKHGRDRNGNQRHRCIVCGKTFIAPSVRPLGDMRIELKEAATALGMLLEGMSVRSVERLTGLHRDTICDLVLVAGENCARLLDSVVRGVECKSAQCDEIWSYVGMKERRRHMENRTGDEGHSWTFIAIDADSKLVLAHQVGQRDHETCDMFLGKLYRATTGRMQFTTDGLAAYTLGVPFTFRNRVDFGQLYKSFKAAPATPGRYSPPQIIKSEKKAIFGDPDMDKVSTSYIERLNLTLRMCMRRFTRLTNGFSKSFKHHRAMQALFFAFYNFVRKHETVRQTPAQAAGLADHAWTIRELLENAAQ